MELKREKKRERENRYKGMLIKRMS